MGLITGTMTKTEIMNVVIFTDLTVEEWGVYCRDKSLTIKKNSNPASWGTIEDADGYVVGEILKSTQSSHGADYDRLVVEDDIEG